VGTARSSLRPFRQSCWSAGYRAVLGRVFWEGAGLRLGALKETPAPFVGSRGLHQGTTWVYLRARLTEAMSDAMTAAAS